MLNISPGDVVRVRIREKYVTGRVLKIFPHGKISFSFIDAAEENLHVRECAWQEAKLADETQRKDFKETAKRFNAKVFRRPS